jgi:hypothetical protein
MVGTFDNGWETLFSVARSVETFDGTTVDKMRIFHFDLAPELQFTFWVAIFAVPFLNLNAFGVDQLNAQRMFCCRSAGDARKAIIWSSVGQLVTVLMLMVGAALFVFYVQHPPTDPLVMNAMKWAGGQPLVPDMVFPVWIRNPATPATPTASMFASSVWNKSHETPRPPPRHRDHRSRTRQP